jgi:uncharacterized membrane protein (UPF0127 family)
MFAMRRLVVLVVSLVAVSVVVSACGGDHPESSPTATLSTTDTAVPAPSLTTEDATPDPQEGDFVPPDPVTGVGDVHEVLIHGLRFQMEVARTPSERARGLMERASLPKDAAMLFVFEMEDYLSFWMKNALIPLDILYLNAQGVVVDVQTMHTQIGSLDSQLKLYRSARPARFVIEMNAGLAGTLGVMPGTQVLFH